MDRRNFIGASGSVALAASAGAALAAGKAGKASIAAVTALISDWRRKDIEAVLARVTDDIVWYTHVGSPPKHGKAEMRAFLEPMAAAMSEIRWRIFNHAVNGDRIFLEGADDFVLAPDKRRVQIPYMGIMAFRGTLICEWRDYFDRGLFDRLKAGEAMPPEIESLVTRPGVP
jgi:limonene-1,2-epoxide hydrolase